MRLIKVKTVTPLGAFRLELTFSDGTCGVADLSDDLDGALVALRDEGLWARARVERGVVSWDDEVDLATEFLYARAHGVAPPTTGEEVEAMQMDVTMRQLRAFAGMTQAEVAQAMGIAQGEVSRLEGRADSKLSTLERYVEALGGEVEVVARFGDRSLRLHLA